MTFDLTPTAAQHDLARRTRGLLESNRVAAVGPQGMLFAVCDGMGGAVARLCPTSEARREVARDALDGPGVGPIALDRDVKDDVGRDRECL